ncbi:MAG: hypothetical protein GY761_20415 [Hyphomicrobiales bacterium]|nr:hypothetical protein [Hyphomicrobiales bacterium]
MTLINTPSVKILSGLFILSALSACQYEELNRSEFMSQSAGNAIAHNSALQIVDPWPRVAGNNSLRVPVVEYGGEPTAEESSPSPIVLQMAGEK